MQTDATGANNSKHCWVLLANNVASVCMGLKVWPVSNYTQQVPTLLWFRVTGGPNKSQHCWAQQCWVRLHGPLLFYYTNTLLFLLLLVLQVTNSFRGWLCNNSTATSTDSNRTDYYYTTTVPILYTIHHSHRHLHIYHFPYSSFMFATRTIFTTSFNVPSETFASFRT